MAGNTRRNRSSGTSRRPSSAAVFAALGDTTRLSLLEALAAGELLSITRLSAGRRVTRQAITKHLHVLSTAGLVRSTRQGREQLWQLDGEPLREAQRQLERISGEWDAALSRLKAHLGE